MQKNSKKKYLSKVLKKNQEATAFQKPQKFRFRILRIFLRAKCGTAGGLALVAVGQHGKKSRNRNKLFIILIWDWVCQFHGIFSFPGTGNFREFSGTLNLFLGNFYVLWEKFRFRVFRFRDFFSIFSFLRAKRVITGGLA